MSVFVTIGSDRFVRNSTVDGIPAKVSDLYKGFHGLSPLLFYTLCNGRKVGSDCVLEDGKSYQIVPRLPGGKGGFGSMLRAIGAQIEKTTSREACRDLSGRRMRDINNEKKLKEWLAKESEREREREERKQERLARRLAPSQHKFEDAQYHEQRSKVQEDLEDALQKGLKKSKKHPNNEPSEAGPSKKTKWTPSKELLGVDLDSDDLQSESDCEADPGSPHAPSSTQPQSPPPTTATDSDHKADSQCASISVTSTSSPISPSTTEDSASAKTVKQESDTQLGKSKDSGSGSNCIAKEYGDLNLKDVDDQDVNVKAEASVKEEIVDNDAPVDLEDYQSISQLAALGLERLKNALMARGLKCGGSLEERAQRLFSVKGLTTDQIDPSLFAKLKGKGKKSK